MPTNGYYSRQPANRRGNRYALVPAPAAFPSAYDYAALPFEEILHFTREAVDFCKSFGVPVEAN